MIKEKFKAIGSRKETVLFFLLAALFVAAKLAITSVQMIHIYAIDSAPIDDGCVFLAAQSILNGNWLGDYSWVTLGKNMFFSIYIVLLNQLHIPYLIANQLLYLAVTVFTVISLRPVIKNIWAKLILFTVIWFSPFSWAQFTLRVYRDSIFPQLVLLFFAGIIGFCLRREQPVKRQIPFALAAGLGFGLSWLTREDAYWIFPFGFCAALVYAFAVAFNEGSIKKAAIKIISVPLLSFAVGMILVGSYCTANYFKYGIFATNDYYSSGFSSAMAAMVRADTDIPHDHNLVCKDTREKLYGVSPSLAKLKPFIENENVYNSYGNKETGEIGSAGICWAIRKAAQDAGFAESATEADAFFSDIAREINAACDEGRIDAFDKCPSINAYILPYDETYLKPTIEEIGRGFKIIFFYEQTDSKAPLSRVTQEEAKVIEDFTYTEASKIAEYNTDVPHYTRVQKAAGLITDAVAWVYRVLTPFAFILSLIYIVRDLWAIFKTPFKKVFTLKFVFAVLLFGIFLSIVVRVFGLSYIQAVNFGISTYVMYYSSAALIGLLAMGYAAAHFVETVIEKKNEKAKHSK